MKTPLTPRGLTVGMALIGSVCIAYWALAQGPSRGASGKPRETDYSSVPLRVWPSASQRIRQIYQSEGLHAAAIANNGRYVHVVVTMTPSLPHDSLEALAAASEVIVVGTVAPPTVRVTGSVDHQLIQSDFPVTVNRFVKGLPASVVTVHMLGGTVRFDDGTEAKVEPAGSHNALFTPGSTYVLFLARVPPGDLPSAEGHEGPAYWLAGSHSQGAFELSSADGLVRAHGSERTPLQKRIEGLRIDRFLEELSIKALPPVGREGLRANQQLEPTRSVRSRVPARAAQLQR